MPASVGQLSIYVKLPRLLSLFLLYVQVTTLPTTHLFLLFAIMDGEIVGLNYGTNGRSCCSHEVCGVSLQPGDLIRIKPAVISHTFKDGSSVVENALKVVKVVDGCETCHVGFIATATVVSSRSCFEDKFGQGVELYKESDNSAIRRKDFEGGGLASFCLLDNVQTYDDSYDKGDESFDEYKP
jgi:hypothetical protein